jgi:hypothetical protein
MPPLPLTLGSIAKHQSQVPAFPKTCQGIDLDVYCCRRLLIGNSRFRRIRKLIADTAHHGQDFFKLCGNEVYGIIGEHFTFQAVLSEPLFLVSQQHRKLFLKHFTVN